LRKYDLAMIDYAKAIELKPDFAEVYNNRGTLRGIMGKYDLALHDLTRAIELKPEDARSHDNLAWFMSTCPDPKFRNADRAMPSAIKACELLRWGDFHSLATLAAAHAAGGEFAEAVKWQTKALELTPAASKSELGSRLELYQSGKPYHQEPQK